MRGRGLPRWGNLRWQEPFSCEWVIDRGTPVDRFFADRYSAENRNLIAGRVLEIQNSIGAAVTQAISWYWNTQDSEGRCAAKHVSGRTL